MNRLKSVSAALFGVGAFILLCGNSLPSAWPWTGAAHQWVQGVDATGTPTFAQPACSDITLAPGTCLISTQTASSSADLHWTALPAADFYEVICTNLVMALNNVDILAQFGESGTWETGAATYAWSYRFHNSGSVGDARTGPSPDTGIALVQTWPSANSLWNSTIIFGGITVTGKPKSIAWTGWGSSDLTSSSGLNGNGTYIGDTNAVTDFRVIARTGNITSGKCSAYAGNS